jgi:phospholipid transport system substrate-binding protein
MKFRFVVAFTALLCSFTFGFANEVAGPEVFIKQGIDGTIAAITENKDREVRYEKVKEIFWNNFDLPRLAGMSLVGDAWKSLSNEEKNIFIDKYSEFVLRFYLGKLEGYNSNKIVVGEAEVKNGTKATVLTSVEFGGKMAQLKYSLTLKDSAWKIYDVEVEGVRLSSTYRNQFQSSLNSKKFKGLIEDLDQLIQNTKEAK